MPTRQTSTDTPTKSRLRGDMYLRAEQRYRAEVAAAQLTGIETISVPAVYEPTPADEPVDVVAAPAVDQTADEPSTTTDDSIEMWPTEGTMIGRPATPPAAGPPPTAAEDALEMWATERTDSPPQVTPPIQTDSLPTAATAAVKVTAFQTPPATVGRPVRPMPASRGSRHVAGKRVLVPASVFGAAALFAALGIGAILWPRSEPQATSTPTRSSQPAPAPVAAPRPVAAQPASSGASQTASPVIAQSARPAGASATANTGTAPPAPLPVEKPAVQAARRERPAVMPVSTASEGQLRVTSAPAGARVTVNGIGWGQTPVTVTNLPLGTKTVRVTRDGYTSQQRIVDLRSDRAAASLHVALQRAR